MTGANAAETPPTSATDRTALLGWVAVLLTPAVLLVPAGLAALRGFPAESAFVAASESAFARADLSGPVAGSPALAELTATWREFHVVKAVVAGLLVVTLLGLVSAVRRRAQSAERGRRRWLLLSARAGVVVWLIGALTILLANVQGAVAPIASVASLLPPGGGTGELAGVLAQLRSSVAAGAPAPAGGIARELLGDFTVYHAAFAVMAAATGGILTTVALRAVWRRRPLRGPGRSPGPPWSVEATLYGAAGCLFLLLALANLSTWLDPVPAFAASLGGG